MPRAAAGEGFARGSRPVSAAAKGARGRTQQVRVRLVWPAMLPVNPCDRVRVAASDAGAAHRERVLPRAQALPTLRASPSPYSQSAARLRGLDGGPRAARAAAVAAAAAAAAAAAQSPTLAMWRAAARVDASLSPQPVERPAPDDEVSVATTEAPPDKNMVRPSRVSAVAGRMFWRRIARFGPCARAFDRAPVCCLLPRVRRRLMRLACSSSRNASLRRRVAPGALPRSRVRGLLATRRRRLTVAPLRAVPAASPYLVVVALPDAPPARRPRRRLPRSASSSRAAPGVRAEGTGAPAGGGGGRTVAAFRALLGGTVPLEHTEPYGVAGVEISALPGRGGGGKGRTGSALARALRAAEAAAPTPSDAGAGAGGGGPTAVDARRGASSALRARGERGGDASRRAQGARGAEGSGPAAAVATVQAAATPLESTLRTPAAAAGRGPRRSAAAQEVVGASPPGSTAVNAGATAGGGRGAAPAVASSVTSPAARSPGVRMPPRARLSPTPAFPCLPARGEGTGGARSPPPPSPPRDGVSPGAAGSGGVAASTAGAQSPEGRQSPPKREVLPLERAPSSPRGFVATAAVREATGMAVAAHSPVVDCTAPQKRVSPPPTIVPTKRTASPPERVASLTAEQRLAAASPLGTPPQAKAVPSIVPAAGSSEAAIASHEVTAVSPRGVAEEVEVVAHVPPRRVSVTSDVQEDGVGSGSDALLDTAAALLEGARTDAPPRGVEAVPALVATTAAVRSPRVTAEPVQPQPLGDVTPPVASASDGAIAASTHPIPVTAGAAVTAPTHLAHRVSPADGSSPPPDAPIVSAAVVESAAPGVEIASAPAPAASPGAVAAATMGVVESSSVVRVASEDGEVRVNQYRVIRPLGAPPRARGGVRWRVTHPGCARRCQQGRARTRRWWPRRTRRHRSTRNTCGAPHLTLQPSRL